MSVNDPTDPWLVQTSNCWPLEKYHYYAEVIAVLTPKKSEACGNTYLQGLVSVRLLLLGRLSFFLNFFQTTFFLTRLITSASRPRRPRARGGASARVTRRHLGKSRVPARWVARVPVALTLHQSTDLTQSRALPYLLKNWWKE